MSTVTLESLLADFEAARQHSISYSGPAYDVEWHSTARPILHDGAHHDARNKAIQCARLYVIARDHGLDAALLFKLSGGNIDPRMGA
jgi:hypothetical protein